MEAKCDIEDIEDIEAKIIQFRHGRLSCPRQTKET